MTPLTFKVLRRLADGVFHSGETLARELGVTRAAVWHALQGLEATGIELHKVHGRGYRLPQPLSLLDREEILRRLGPRAARFAIEVVEAVGSTNTLLMQRAEAGAPDGTVVAAEWQSRGRGRLGREWHASLGGALTFSVLRRFAQGVGFLSGLSLAVGVALMRALGRLDALEVTLKWPNDVLWRGRKLAGILIEMHGDTLGPSAAVIGVGLNVGLPDSVRARIAQPAADLATALGKPVDRNALLALVLTELASVLDVFARDGFAPFKREWESRHAHHAQPVTVLLPDGRRESGMVRGVAEDGALLVETRAGARRYHSGEISVRAPAPGRARQATR